MIPRGQTRKGFVGGVAVGGNAPIAIQSMTSTYTRDVDATAAQLRRLADAGCDIVRVGPGKIPPDHRDRLAVVYVRQSSAQQVLEHRESAALHYALIL